MRTFAISLTITSIVKVTDDSKTIEEIRAEAYESIEAELEASLEESVGTTLGISVDGEYIATSTETRIDEIETE